MANLPETPDYPAGVYQLETSDPVLGGAGGIANRQAEQLGNRTAWLKAKIDAFLDGTVAVLKATKLATARTLSFSGAASGSAPFDGSADANIVLTLAASGAVAGTYPKVTVNAKGLVTGGAALLAADIPILDWSKIGSGKPTTLGGYGITDGAPLASPTFTGDPKAPTPAQFDNDTSLMTTAFAKRMGVEFSGFNSINASTVLTNSSVGGVVSAASAAAINVTLPPTAGVPHGGSLLITNAGNGAVTLLGSGADLTTSQSGSTVSIVLGTGDSAWMVKVTGEWRLESGSAALKYSAMMPGLVSGFSGVQRFAANGSFTVPDGITKIYVTAAAGGGGGGGGHTANYSGEGGGGGAFVLRMQYAVTPGQVLAITVGGGGVAGAIGGAGGAGGSTSVGAFVTLSGGAGGNPGVSGGGGSGAGFGGGSGNGAGGAGGDAVGATPGAGGASLGYGGSVRISIGASGTLGGGGAGGYTNYAGGPGAPGIVLIEW